MTVKHEPRVVGVRASIALRDDEEKAELAARFNELLVDDPDRERVVEHILDPGRYYMYACLSATLADGREVTAGGRSFGWAAPRDGIGAIVHRYRGPKLSDDPAEHTQLLDATYHVSYDDVKDHVDQALGRHPELRRRSHLSWGRLIAALEAAGVTITEEQLIAAPLELTLSDEVKAELRMSS